MYTQGLDGHEFVFKDIPEPGDLIKFPNFCNVSKMYVLEVTQENISLVDSGNALNFTSIIKNKPFWKKGTVVKDYSELNTTHSPKNFRGLVIYREPEYIIVHTYHTSSVKIFNPKDVLTEEVYGKFITLPILKKAENESGLVLTF